VEIRITFRSMTSASRAAVCLLGLALLAPDAFAQNKKQAKKQDTKDAPVAAPVGVPPVDPANKPSYRLGPGDVVEIRIWKEPELSVPEATVRTDGRISLPLVKEVEAGGLTIEELEKALVVKYKPLVKDPDITIILRQSNSQRAYVMGAVRKEGTIKLVDRMTVLQALAEAGGLTEYAKRKKIFILRGASGKQTRIPFDYEAVITGAKPELNVAIEPGDTIVVPN